MKPTILHLVNGHSMGWTGGISATLRSLMDSRLGDQYHFAALSIAEFWQTPLSQRPAAIAVHGPSAWAGLKTLWRLKRIAPLILAEHHYSAHFELTNVPSLTRFRWMLRCAYGLADRVIAVSAAQQHWMLKHRLVAARKVALIQSSRQVDQFLAIAPKSRQIDQPLVVGAYGRLCPQKGFDVLIEAMKHLNHNQVRLQIGGTGPDEAALKHQAQGCDTIQFLGRIDDVPQFLSQCDVIVIPSRWEPWGNVCLEARAAATPVIVTAVDGLPEQVQAFGQVIPAGNAVALARTLADFTQMPAQTLSQFGEQGRLSAQGAWDTYLDQWQSLLEKVV